MEMNFNIEDFDNRNFGRVIKSMNNIVNTKQVIEYSFIGLDNKPVVQYMAKKNGKTYFSSNDLPQTMKVFEII